MKRAISWILYCHMDCLFYLSICNMKAAPARRLRVFNSLTPQQFCTAFKNSITYSLEDFSGLTVDDCTSMFDSLCTEILDSIAPMTLKCIKPQKEPWLNKSTHVLRSACRQAERKWKKDNLQISLDLLRDCLISYQQAVKVAKTKYFSSLVSTNVHNLQAHSLVNPCDAVCIEPSATLSAIRNAFPQSAQDPSAPLVSSAILDH